MFDEDNKIPVGVSSCLLGHEVRFNGGHKRDSFIATHLTPYFEFFPFCPEVAIGLGVPRKSLRLERLGNEIRVIPSRQASEKTSVSDEDYTDQLIECADSQSNWHENLCGYIVKRSSPSCGMERVKVFHNGQPTNIGVGLYTKRLMENFPNLPVEEEGRLEDPVIRENFIQRVIIYHRWKNFTAKEVNKSRLMNFHGRIKLTLMSHNQDLTRALGADLAKVQAEELEMFIPEYLQRMMAILKIWATRKNHVNVLQHIQGYLKKNLATEHRQEMANIIHEYRIGHVPLIVPITLLRHHFVSHACDYIDNSFYMNPHPKELKLLNSI